MVLRISNTLRETGVDTYIAEEDIKAGESLSGKIEKQIEKSDCVLVILTDEGTRSDSVNQEIGYAKGKKLIIPLVEKGKRVGALLQGIEYIRFDPADPQEAFHKAIAYIKKLEVSKEDKELIKLALVATIGLVAVGLILAKCKK